MVEGLIVPTEELLSDLSDMVGQKGDPYDIGCSENSIEAMCDFASSINNQKKIRTVKSWQWWDLQVPCNIKFPDSLMPIMIYASSLVSDSAYYLRPGDWVRSTPLLSIHERCITETTNSFYILVGPGTRKTVTLESALSFV
ncbi:hypothetical protein MNBD_GAMMA12-851 [hydrothermal vent metagenome]|uniref:DUF6957 domain-containing protein n=1 Tax=hydrothermal vent metagenome TaxID=652676 RepID=A0A3B0YIH2_9ZZZZ